MRAKEKQCQCFPDLDFHGPSPKVETVAAAQWVERGSFWTRKKNSWSITRYPDISLWPSNNVEMMFSTMKFWDTLPRKEKRGVVVVWFDTKKIDGWIWAIQWFNWYIRELAMLCLACIGSFVLTLMFMGTEDARHVLFWVSIHSLDWLKRNVARHLFRFFSMNSKNMFSCRCPYNQAHAQSRPHV